MSFLFRSQATALRGLPLTRHVSGSRNIPHVSTSAVQNKSKEMASNFYMKLAAVTAGLVGLSWWFRPSSAQTSQHQKPEEKMPDVSRSRINPFNNITLKFSGYHFYADDMTKQVFAQHYCSHLADDVHQCVIYDSDRMDARIIGVEYIVPEKVFLTLPEEEKKFWHSHSFEVKSGLLTDPSLPVSVENAVMAKLANSYGKTFHTWQVDRGDKVPMGPPQLMMSFTGPGQMHPLLAFDRDQHGCFYDPAAVRRVERAGITPNPVAAGADHWKSGAVYQVQMQQQKANRHFNPKPDPEWNLALPQQKDATGNLAHVTTGGLWEGVDISQEREMGVEAFFKKEREELAKKK